MDLFGLEREQKIGKSGVRNVFTPHQPIQSLGLFFGRRSEVQRIVEHLNTPGQHALLFGERGVGKSSLANVTCELILKKLVQGEYIKKRCDGDDSFFSMIAPALNQAGVDLKTIQSVKTKKEGGNAGIGIPGVKAGVKTETTNAHTTSGFTETQVTASWAAEKLAALEGLFLIDEVDAIKDRNSKVRLAELIKLMSDQASKLKFFLVGIAETSSELTAGHLSVQRCLKETRLSRMSSEELSEIITNGQDELNLKFSRTSIERIVTVSSGYPHFTHLLALKSAEDAIAEDRREINVTHVESATRRAVEDAEGTLKKAYDEAVRSAGTDMYRHILLAAALCPDEEIIAEELRKSYTKLTGEEITQGSLNNYLKRLVSDGGDLVLRRIVKGVYRFSDPRMSSYIRIAQSHLVSLPEL